MRPPRLNRGVSPALDERGAIVRKLTVFVICAVLAGACAFAAQEKPVTSFIPKNGFVPDAVTATRIAEAICSPIFGEANIAREKPFIAVLKGDIWVVTGTLPPGLLGGVAVAEIAKSDGRIISVVHGQ
jgi:hypothetical protein